MCRWERAAVDEPCPLLAKRNSHTWPSKALEYARTVAESERAAALERAH